MQKTYFRTRTLTMNIVQVHNPQPKNLLRIDYGGNTCNFNCGYCFKDSRTHRSNDGTIKVEEF